MSPREKSLSKAVLSYGLLPHFFLYRSCPGKESIIHNFLSFSFKESGLFPAGLLHVFPPGEKQHSCRLSTFAFSEFRCIESWVRHAMRRRVSAWSRIRDNSWYKREGTKLGKFLLESLVIALRIIPWLANQGTHPISAFLWVLVSYHPWYRLFSCAPVRSPSYTWCYPFELMQRPNSSGLGWLPT